MIDWNRVENLRAEIGVEDFLEVAAMFLDEAEEVVTRLRGGVSDGGFASGLEAELHFLKGSALNLGFRELAGLCNDGEKLASAGAPVDVVRVIRCYIASRADFEAGESGHLSRTNAA